MSHKHVEGPECHIQIFMNGGRGHGHGGLSGGRRATPDADVGHRRVPVAATQCAGGGSDERVGKIVSNPEKFGVL